MSIKISNDRAVSAYQRERAAGSVSNTGSVNGAGNAQRGVRPDGAAASASFTPQALALASQSTNFDQAKVDRLKTEIDNGTYQVDSEAVAGKIADHIYQG